jgi:hypothetical protein
MLNLGKIGTAVCGAASCFIDVRPDFEHAAESKVKDSPSMSYGPSGPAPSMKM